MKRYIQIGISLLCIFYLIVIINWSEVWSVIKGINFKLFIFLLLAGFCLEVIPITRWRRLLAAQGVKVKFFYLLKYYFIALFASNFLPSNIGGDLSKIYFLIKDYPNAKKEVTAAILVDRLVGVSAVLVIFFLAIILFFNRFVDLFNIQWSDFFWKLLLVFGVILGLVATLLLFRKNNLIQKLRLFLWQVLKQIFIYRHQKVVLLQSLFLSFIYQTGIIFLSYGFFLALNPPIIIPLYYFFIFIPLSVIIILLPISINGVGLRENVYIALFRHVGIAKSLALSFSLLNTFFLLLESFLGGIFLLFLKKNKKIN